MTMRLDRVVQRVLVMVVLAGIGVAQVGCNSTPPPRSTPAPTDWEDFADRMVVEIVRSGIIDEYPMDARGKVPIAIGSFRNRSTNRWAADEADIMFNKIETALIKSDRVTASTRFGRPGSPTAALIDTIRQIDPALMEQQTAIPRLVLDGEIIAVETERGRQRNYYYQVKCRLHDVGMEDVVWTRDISASEDWERPLIGG